jgi:hypothetical protein
MRAANAAVGGDAALRAWQAVRRLALRLERVRPLYVLAPLVVLQWLLVLGVALSATHNGWLYFQGGDGTEYWAHEWALAHGLLPNTVLGYAVPILFAWVPLVFGTSPLTGLPAIELAQTILLAPVVIASLYGLASRLAGRVFAAFAALLFVVAPVASIPLWRQDYHDRYVSQFLPQAFGLVNMGDFASVVVVVAASYFVFRALDDGRANDAVLAGLLMGTAIGVKPSNALILPVPVVVLALVRRWRQLGVYLAALAPAVVTLALWKERGLGSLPLLSAPELHEAAGTHFVASSSLAHYFNFDLSQLRYNLGQLREFFWSRLLCEFVVVAGAFAVLRKAPVKGIYLLLWFTVFFVVKGGSHQADLRAGSFLRLTMPGLPAFVLLAAATALLVPFWGRRQAQVRPAWTPPRPTRGLVVSVALLAVLPLIVVSAARPAPAGKLARLPVARTDAPITADFHLHAVKLRDGVRLVWDGFPTAGAKGYYVVYRSLGFDDGCGFTGIGSELCVFHMGALARTAITHVDDTPFPGHYMYRVGFAASWQAEDADSGDVMLLSEAIAADVFCDTAKCTRDSKAAVANGTFTPLR